MNILVVCHYGMYQDLQSSFVHAQTAAYAALGHRVRVIVPVAWGKRSFDGERFGPPLKKRTADGVEYYALRYLSLSGYGQKHFNTASAIAALRPQLDTVIAGFRPQVIHAHTLGFDSDIGAWLKARLGLPLVVTTHGSDTAVPYYAGQKETLRALADRADTVVAVSSTLEHKLLDCGVSTGVSVIWNGFRIQNLAEGVERRPLSFMQVSALNYQKRVCNTIDAFALIREKHPEATLALAGDGPDRAALEKQVQRLGLTDCVRFLGTVPNKELMRHLAATEFFIMVSHREGFGVSYLEAMASGCLTVGSEGEGIADFITSGHNGCLVPVDDVNAIAEAVEHCLAHPEEMAAMAARGREMALRLTWQANAAAYTELFTRLIKKEV